MNCQRVLKLKGNKMKHKNILHTILITLAIIFMSTYLIYRNVQYGGALSQYSRQLDFMAGKSEFYNPWQYRVLCPFLNLIFFNIYIHTIPVLYWFYFAIKEQKFQLPPFFINIITGLSLFTFAIIYIGIRWYYGLRPAEVASPLEGLSTNLISWRGYLEIFGTTSILPLWCILHWKKAAYFFRLIFIGLVPVWFLIHFSVAAVWESRLFLVPTILIFLPMTLETLEKLMHQPRLN